MFSAQEVAKHNCKTDAWIIYNHGVYDVTNWIQYHPGGQDILSRFAGKDATDEMQAFHDMKKISGFLADYWVGSTAPSISLVQRDFRKLGLYFEKMKFLEPPSYYKESILLCIYFCVVIYLALSYPLVAAVALGMFWQQTAFLCHDIGHNTSNQKMGYFLGNLLSGTGLAWWKHSHYIHHTAANNMYEDPDIHLLPFFCLHKKFFESIYCTYHKRIMEFGRISSILVPYQHYLYYPIMAVSRVNLYFQSMIFQPCDRIGLLLQLLFLLWYFTLLSRIANPILFHFLSHAVAGILHIQITLSHFARPINTEELDFFTRGVDASMDIDCHRAMDWFHGGLQFQTTHHLFPRLQRQKLRKATVLVKTLCEKHNLPYTALSFQQANVVVFRRLRQVASEADGWFSGIWDSINANG